MTIRPRHLAAAAFVLTEAFAWYIILHVIGTAIAREAFGQLATDLPRVLDSGVVDAERLRRALQIASAGVEAAGGPPLVVVAGAAAAAYLFMRWVRRPGVPIEIAVPVGIAATILAFHVLLHLAVARDLRIWESSAIVSLVGGASTASGPIDAMAFALRPDPARVRYAADLWISIGLFLLWIRFLIAGRGEIHYDRSLRSFGVGFTALLIAAFFGGVLAQVDISGLIVAYFVLGIVSLALAHAARTAASEEITGRSAPWLVSVGVTVGALAGLALLLGLLALLRLDRLFQPVVQLILDLVGQALVLVLTPFLYIVRWILESILGQADPATVARLRDIGAEITRPPTRETSLVPDWVFIALKALALGAVGWVVYRLARLIFQRVRRATRIEEYAELREAAGGSGGGPGLLAGLFRRRGAETGFDGEWLRRHAVYRLYARVVTAARARGLQRRPGDTPIEFARASAARFNAPAFPPIGEAFDGARYGRHYPATPELEAMERDLDAWEQQHPPGTATR